MAKTASPTGATSAAKPPRSGNKGRNPTSTARVSGDQGILPETVPDDAIALLEADHRVVERLFGRFEQASGDADQRDIVNAICVALKVHARLEEELLYPAAAGLIDEPTLIMEAMVEHATAKDLIAQIETGAPGEPLFVARVKVLAEYVAHHVAEEENEIFPRFRGRKLDLEKLGAAMALRRQELSLGFLASNPVIGLADDHRDANT